jgi:hypothetical protein
MSPDPGVRGVDDRRWLSEGKVTWGDDGQDTSMLTRPAELEPTLDPTDPGEDAERR